MATITAEQPLSLRTGLVEAVDHVIFAGRRHFDQFLDGLDNERQAVTARLSSPFRDPYIAPKYFALTDDFLQRQQPEIKRQFFHNFALASFARVLFYGEMFRQLASAQIDTERLLTILFVAGISERAGLLLTRKSLRPVSDTVHNLSTLALESPDSVRFARDTFAHFPQLQNQP